MGRLRVVGMAVLAGWIAACGLSRAERSTLRRWLLCDDCMGGELDSVARIGGAASPTLVRSLIEGPLPARRENVRRQAVDNYAQLVAYVAPDTVSIPAAVYTQEFVDNYVATYQIRAVFALQRIGTGAARAGLRQALELSTLPRGDVLRAIGDALGAAIIKQSGDSQFASTNAFVPVPPQVVVRDSAGSPLENVRVTFAIDSGGGAVVDSVKRTNSVGVATVGGWRLGANPGRKILRATAAGRVIRFVATANP